MALLSQEQRLSLKKLSQHPLVRNISYNNKRVLTKFTTGIDENWIIREDNKISKFGLYFPQSNLMTEHGLPIYSEFETHPLDEDEIEYLKPFFIVQRRDIKKAGFVDIRLMVHQLIDRLKTEKWIRLKYPRSVIESELTTLGRCNMRSYFLNDGTINAFGGRIVGRAIAEHFLNWGECTDGRTKLSDAWKSASHLYSSISDLLRSRNDITRANIVRYLGITGGRRNSGPKFINPHFYYSLIKTFFGKTTSIYDIDPGWGSKLLASSIIGADYFANDCEALQDMAKFIKCKMEQKQRYDLAILSGTDPVRADTAMELLSTYKSIADFAFILVHRDDVDSVKAKFLPRRILKAQICPRILLKKIGFHYFMLY